MSGFTKGDWRKRGNEIGVVDQSDTQSYGMMLTICMLDEYDFKDEWEANAHLISAAPKMYDLLERLTDHNNNKKQIIHLLGEADSLLKKARGEV